MGAVGLKTTLGQVSRAGVFPLSSSLDSVGPLTRTVEDAALVYQAMHGADAAADPSTAGAEAQDVMADLERGVGGLRIAVGEGVFWDQVEPEVEAAVRAAAEVLAKLGAEVESVELPEAAAALAANPNGLISGVEACLAHDRRLGPDFDAYDPVVLARIRSARAASAVAYLGAREACAALARELHERLLDVDVFLTPTTPIVAKPVAEVDASLDAYWRWAPLYSRNTSVGNLLGLTALSLPCGVGARGMPIGLMVHGKARAEALVLRVGHAYEQATAWHRRIPDLAWVT